MRASVLTNKQFYTLLALAAVAAYVLYRKSGDLLELVNPTDRDNLANQGFNKVYKVVTGSDGTLGTDVADGDYEAVDPTSKDNLANQGAVSAYQWLTGSSGTPGTDLAGWMHGE